MSGCSQRKGVYGRFCRGLACGLLGLLTVTATAQHSKKKHAATQQSTKRAPAARKPARSQVGGLRSRLSAARHHGLSGHALSLHAKKTKPHHGKAAARAEETALRPSITERIQIALSDPSVGIEGGRFLAPFFAQLKALQAAPGSSEVRILHFGDSHTAADLIHPSPQGARIVAQALTSQLLIGYERYVQTHPAQ